MEKMVEQSSTTLRDRAAEVSSMLASELDHYRRTYVEHSTAQIEDSAKEMVSRERDKMSETAQIATAGFTDQVHRVTAESLQRFEQVSREALEKARSDMEFNREGSLPEYQKALDERMMQGVEQATVHLQSQLGPLIEQWESKRESEKKEWMEQLKKSNDEAIEPYKTRLENASNSWLLASATTLGQHSQTVLDTIAKAAEKRLRETCSEVLGTMGDTLKARLLGLSTDFGPEPEDEFLRRKSKPLLRDPSFRDFASTTSLLPAAFSDSGIMTPMANQAYLSIWLKEFSEESMLERFGDFLGTVPFSAKQPGFTHLEIRAVDSTETPVYEQDLRSFPLDAAGIIELAKDYVHDDCSCDVRSHWDLWVFEGEPLHGAATAAVAFELLCNGEDFDDGFWKDNGHLEVSFGFEHLFTGHGAAGHPPDRAARAAESGRARFSGIHGEAGESTAISGKNAGKHQERCSIGCGGSRRRCRWSDCELWSEGEENFEARLEEILAAR